MHVSKKNCESAIRIVKGIRNETLSKAMLCLPKEKEDFLLQFLEAVNNKLSDDSRRVEARRKIDHDSVGSRT